MTSPSAVYQECKVCMTRAHTNLPTIGKVVKPRCGMTGQFTKHQLIMAIYKSKIVCINKFSTFALTVEVVEGGQSLKFNNFLKGQVNNILGSFKEEYINGIMTKTDGVTSDDYTIIPKYLTNKVTITVHSKRADKGARTIAEDIDWYLFPRLQSVLAQNGCELTK